jgi:hypothetical protein
MSHNDAGDMGLRDSLAISLLRLLESCGNMTAWDKLAYL